MEHYNLVTDKKNPNLSQCQYIHKKYYIHCPDSEPGPPHLAAPMHDVRTQDSL